MAYNYSTNVSGYEICYFRNICNEVIPYPEDGLDYLPIKNSNYYIPAEDIIIYTSIKGEKNLCPIKYTIDRYNNKIIIDSKYKQYKLYYGSRNQFLYQRIPLNLETQSIPLPYIFRTGYNENNYFVFLNGRLLNNSFYKILLPTLEDNRIENKILYMSKSVTADDTLDVFYISNSGFNRINGFGDLIVKPYTVKATEPIQRQFIIPIPYKNYPVDDSSSFMVFKHGTMISTDKYNIKRISDGVYSVDLLDIDDYLNYGEELVFIFPLYKNDWETSNEISSSNSLQFATVYTTTTTASKNITFPKSSLGNITISSARYIYVFKETDLVSPKDYYILRDNTIQFKETIPANTNLAVVIQSDKDTINSTTTQLNYVNIPVLQDGQWNLTLPNNNYDGYIMFKNGELLPKDHYSISNNKLILGMDYNDLKAGDIITAVYAIDGTTDYIDVNFQQYKSTATSDNTIIIPNPNNIRYTNNNIIVFINNHFIAKRYYTITGNTIIFNDGIVETGDSANVYMSYKVINASKTNYSINSGNAVSFDRYSVIANTTEQNIFTFSYPDNLPDYIIECPILVFLRGILVSESDYTITNNNTTSVLKLSSSIASKIKSNDILDIVFCYSSVTTVSKKEYRNVLTSDTLQLPYVYSEPIDLSERILVFDNGSFINNDRYTIDKSSRTITFIDNNIGSTITCVFLYTGSANSGSVGYLPQSGYILFDEYSIDRNLNKNLLMIFVNGLLVPKSNIHDLSNNLKKITRNLKTRYDLNIINCSPLITEFKKIYDAENNTQKCLITIDDSLSHESIKVTIGTWDGDENKDPTYTTYTKSFTFNTTDESHLLYSFKVQVIPDEGYIAGEYTLNGIKGGTPVNGIYTNLTISAYPATKASLTKKLGRVTITQSANQTIYVTCNGTVYTESFDEIIDTPIKVAIKANRDGYETGVISKSSNYVTTNTTVSATSAKADTFTLNILDKNLDNQNVTIKVYEADTQNILASETAPCSLADIPFGSKFIVTAIPDDGYAIGNNIGPFKLNQSYYIDYMYPLDNLVIDPVTKNTYHTISITSSANSTIYLDTWSENNSDGKIRYTCKNNDISVKLVDGTYYQCSIEADYGYIANNLVSSNGNIGGVLDSDITITAEAALQSIPKVIIKREDNTSEYYTIKVDFNDGYQPVSEGIYNINKNSFYSAKCILHGIVHYTLTGIIDSELVIITLKQDGTITVSD